MALGGVVQKAITGGLDLGAFPVPASRVQAPFIDVTKMMLLR